MADLNNQISGFTLEERSLFFEMISFPIGFSVDWFPFAKASQINKVIQALRVRQWLEPEEGKDGFFSWTNEFSDREKILALIPKKERKTHHCNAVEILKLNQSSNARALLEMANKCVDRGVSEDDLDLILTAADIEEKRHELFSAYRLYEVVIDFIGKSSSDKSGMTDAALRRFIKAVEHRTALAIFYPDHHTLKKWLFLAEDFAVQLGDKRLQASIGLLVSQYYCVTFHMKNAIKSLKNAQEIIRSLGDKKLFKRSLKLLQIVHVYNGHLRKAVEAYEQSVGRIETFEEPFSLYAALGVSLTYTEMGMTQRALGICEAIRNQWRASECKEISAVSYFMEGNVFLQTRQLANSRLSFERALTCCNEDMSPYPSFARIGLVCIDFLEGKLCQTSLSYLKSVSSETWINLLNFIYIFECAYRLCQENKRHFKNNPFELLLKIKKEQLFPKTFHVVRRLQILSDGSQDKAEKIQNLLKLEKDVAQGSESFELANIRIELSRLYFCKRDRQQAESFAKLAWKFLHPIAPQAFPIDLQSLIPPNPDWFVERSLVNLVIEMGKSLTKKEGIEQLLTGIITSISRMTGAERAALFIRDVITNELKIAASRNLTLEDTLRKEFERSYSTIRKISQSSDKSIRKYQVLGPVSEENRTVMITPLMLNEKNIGVLYQDSRFFYIDFNSENEEILSALASQIAVSIDRAQAHDAIEDLNKKLIQENLYYLDEKEEFRPFGEIIGSNSAMLNVQNLIKKVAPTPSTVLIYGETGVGKELVSRAIHRESPRKDKPFIRVNCAALPDSLIDSELFGHERGAFTGAIQTRAGRFELAHEGTLFLDEISELPLSTQSRLLRVLQEKEFQRVGGTKMLHSDFRLITATNKDLKKEVEQGRFREDLFYRLNVYPIHVPPLRERPEDIPALAMHFLDLFRTMYNKHYAGITKAEMDKLIAYAWPGNIRELSNVIERAIIASGSKLMFSELKSKGKGGALFDQREIVNLKEYEKKCATDLILKALEKSGGQIGGKNGAAELLGMKRTALVLRIKRLGIKVEHKPSAVITF